MITHPIKEIASRLERLNKSRKRRLDLYTLFDLLCSGALKAGFSLPGQAVTWLSIPPEFWTRFSRKKFAQIVHAERTIRFSDICDFYVRAVKGSVEKAKVIQAFQAEFDLVVSIARCALDPVVQEDEWQKYLASNGLVDPVSATKKGRHQLPGWKEIAEIVARHMLALGKSGEKQDVRVIAKEVLAAAKSYTPKIVGIPSLRSIEDCLYKALETRPK